MSAGIYPPNLYIRNNGYYCYRDPRTGKEFGLGRDRRIAITEAIQANIELLSDSGRKSLIDRIKGGDAITLHVWLDRYETILTERGIRPKNSTRLRQQNQGNPKKIAGQTAH
ncbi:phage integrase Arm DNA-binding domain-containing protein [Escherichia coli]|nr:phage integrase Arm DNA-binding domain-containing protein [Escherichia coli]